MSYSDPNDIIMGTEGPPSVKFPTIGSEVIGEIVSIEQTQDREFGTGNLKFWPKSGDPLMIAVITLKTDERDPSIEDDDGKRRLFVNKKLMKEAIKAAVLASNSSRIETRGKLAVAYTHDEPNPANPAQPAKGFQARYKTPEPGLSVDVFGGPPAPQQAVQQSQPVPAPAAPPVPAGHGFVDF